MGESREKVFYGYTYSEEIRSKSSSGGIFYELARKIEKDGGVVFGVVFNKEKKIAYYESSDNISIEEMMRSKYVAAEMGDTYSRVLELIKGGRRVLFCGTPCIIAGLSKLVETLYPKLKENLLLVDFLCGGVPSPEVFKEYLNGLEKRYNDKVKSINFRSKTYGWNIYCMKVEFESGRDYIKPYYRDSYLNLFLNMRLNRYSCYNCRFRNDKKSDMTIGDFWNILSVDPKENDNRGVSVIMVHTLKGLDMLHKMKQEIKLIPVPNEKIDYSIQHPDDKTTLSQRQVFYDSFIRNGYNSAAKQSINTFQKRGIVEELGRIKFDLKLTYIKKKKERQLACQRKRS